MATPSRALSKKLLRAALVSVLVLLMVAGAVFITGCGCAGDPLATTQEAQTSGSEGSSGEASSSDNTAKTSDEESSSNSSDSSGGTTVPSNESSSSLANAGTTQGGGATAEQPSSGQPAETMISVSVFIDGSRGGGASYTRAVSIPSGSSVYDALAATGASLSGTRNYVASINGLAEKSQGGGSGWLYFVNGVSPGVGCGSYKLYGGEIISWRFTLDMGNDL